MLGDDVEDLVKIMKTGSWCRQWSEVLLSLMAKIIDWFPKIIFCAIPEIIMLMIPNAGIIKM